MTDAKEAHSLLPTFVRGDPCGADSLAAYVLSAPPPARPFLPTREGRADGTGSRSRTPLPASAFVAPSPETRNVLERILAGEGDFVSTGQQPGLFLGPRYTLYKAASAVARARRRGRRTGKPCLAVFWIASDDHDWDEVATCRVLRHPDELEVLRLDPPRDRSRRSVGESPLGPDVTALIERLERAVRGVAPGAGPGWLGDVVDAYRPEATFASAFAAAMCRVFEGAPIVFLDSRGSEVRRAAASLFERVLADPSSVIEAMQRGREAVTEAGYEPILRPPGSGTQVFVDDGGGREHLLATDDGFRIGDRRIDRESIVGRLAEEPSAFSPAAALRPVLESHLLPVAETVLGPGEMGYWAQLPPLFEAFDVARPDVWLRDSWIVVEPSVERWLEKLGLPAWRAASATYDPKAWVSEAVPSPLQEAFDRAADGIEAGYDSLRTAIEEEFPGLKSAEGKARHRSTRALAELRDTVEREVARREGVSVRRLRRVMIHLRPEGLPQERMLAGVSLYARYGPEWVGRLIEASGREPDAVGS